MAARNTAAVSVSRMPVRRSRPSVCSLMVMCRSRAARDSCVRARPRRRRRRVGGDVVEDAGAEFAQQGGVELAAQSTSTPTALSAASAPAAACTVSTVSAMTRTCSTSTARRPTLPHPGRGRVERRGELDQPAGGTDASRNRSRSQTAVQDAPCAVAVPRPSNSRTRVSLTAARRCSRRCAASNAATRSCSRSPGGRVEAGRHRGLCLLQRIDHRETLEQVYDNFVLTAVSDSDRRAAGNGRLAAGAHHRAGG